jgi:hypothetical protein
MLCFVLTSYLIYAIYYGNIINNIVWSVTDLVPTLPSNCKIHLQNVTVQGNYLSIHYTLIPYYYLISIGSLGAYALWNAEIRSCLQRMSDALVTALWQYIVPNQPVPDWVYQLPEPLRSQKIGKLTQGLPF